MRSVIFGTGCCVWSLYKFCTVDVFPNLCWWTENSASQLWKGRFRCVVQGKISSNGEFLLTQHVKQVCPVHLPPVLSIFGRWVWFSVPYFVLFYEPVCFTVPENEAIDTKHKKSPSGDQYTLVVKNHNTSDENSALHFSVPKSNHHPGETFSHVTSFSFVLLSVPGAHAVSTWKCMRTIKVLM